jgi:CBS domain-containing protein
VAVVDDGALVGVVTVQDLLYQEVEADEHVPYVAPFLDWVVYVQSLGSWERHVEKAFAVTVSDLMSKHVHTADIGQTLHEAAKTMAKENVSMLPVLDGSAYAGVVTRRHVVVALDRFEFGGETA